MPAPAAEWIQDVEPTYQGGFGNKVWRWTYEPPNDPRNQTTIGDSWLIFAPAAHMLWAWHVLMAVSLADVEGLPAAKKHYSAAEYELIVYALHPDHPAPDPRRFPRPGELHFLEPPDVVVQFHDVPKGNQGAGELVELCARSCATGALIPDSDYQSLWQDSVAATLDHVRHGEHDFLN